MFAYLWRHDPKYPKSRNKGTNNGIAKEYGEKLYRENIHDHTFSDLYEKTPSFNQCKKGKMHRSTFDNRYIISTWRINN